MGYTLFPGGDDTGWSNGYSVTEKNAIKNSGSGTEFQIYLIGVIRYRDQFKIPHCTTFPYRRQPLGSIFGAVFEFRLSQVEIPGAWVKWHGTVDSN